MAKASIIFSNECLGYELAGHPESPQRVKQTAEFLKSKGFKFQIPQPASEEDILLAHSEKLLRQVKENRFFDPDTPNYNHIYDFARLSAGAAIEAALLSLKGKKAFSLMRPPGHHASLDKLGGFCYFNNIAIAVRRAQKTAKKITIVDFDCHHGNGTQDIFLGDDTVQYISLHQSPLYPGTGLSSLKNCFNFPLSPGTTSHVYLDIFKQALKNVSEFNPDLIAVSAGFDTYKDDPLTQIYLEKDTFEEIGKQLSSLNKPLFSVLEGGYSPALAECVYRFLIGLE